MLKHVISFPHRLGQPRHGVEKAPSLLVNHFQKKHSFQHHEVNCEEKREYFHKNVKRLYYVNNNIHQNELRLNIGGDHSMSMATVAHSLNRHVGCKVIWVDAHADINTFEASTTKNIHGMPLAYLTALSHDPRYSFIYNTLRFDRLLYVGLRSIDTFEEHILKKHRIPYFTSHDINHHKDDCLSAIDAFLKDSPFHLSFDVDGFDPSLIKHTGTPVPHGLQEKPGIELLQHLTSKQTLVNMDLTEVNADVDQSPIDNTLKIIDQCLEPLWRK